MFRTHMGPVEDDDNLVYLRPETAQGIFINYENVRRANRLSLPFGIAQIGKAFRNEITPGQFVFRTREFEQMEMEFFTRPDEAKEWFEYWQKARLQWYFSLGMTEENLRIRPHEADELSHYSAGTVDVEYAFPWGWDELEGIANRTDFDLRQHSEHSGEDLRYFDQQTNERFFPYVIEPAAGATRTTFAFLIDAYTEEEVRGETRTVLKLHPRLAPYKVAILPLSKKAELIEPASKLAADLRPAFHARDGRHPVDRSPLPAPGRDRHPLRGDGRLRDSPGRSRDDSPPRHDGTGPDPDERGPLLPNRPLGVGA